MIQAIVKKGKVFKQEVLAPNVTENSLLIKVINSCISPGTEISGVQTSGKSIMQKAIAQPEKITKFIDWLHNDGIDITLKKFRSETKIGSPTGYSISGIVLNVGKGCENFSVGDQVVAAGNFANHAEIVNVQKNLVVKIPHSLDFYSSSTATIGAIALQGIRRANLNLGEFAVVYGTGLIGLLTVQMLIHSGIRVAAIDLDQSRLELAKQFGAEIICCPENENSIDIVKNWSDGFGADAVIFTAATQSNEPLSNSFKMAKKKGKVVLVGVSGMLIQRSDIYQKEIDFLISSSYGPGRYDKNYEDKGNDYPYEYVRWTENRNIKEYLRLLDTNAVSIKDLPIKRIKIDELEQAFSLFESGKSKPLGVILEYNNSNAVVHQTKQTIITNPKNKKGIINIGFIGVGSFAKNIHLPNISKLESKFKIAAIMSQSSYKAKGFSEIYGANYITNNYDEILNDKNIDLVFICTQHINHGELVLKALRQKKNVFVEKPLTINENELTEIEKFYQKNQNPLLMVGYNRRFSVYAHEIKKHVEKRINPLIINYRMNAGLLPKDHWIFDQGGRIIGEACHIFDLFNFLIASDILTVNIEEINPRTSNYINGDNKLITLKYADGSIATLSYFSIGSNKLSKEYMEVHFDGKSIIMDNYQSLTGFGLKINNIKTNQSDKGHYEELLVLFDSLNGYKKNWPIPLNDLLQTSKISFLASGK